MGLPFFSEKAKRFAREFEMTKDFRKKTQNLIKRLVKEKKLKLFKLKISYGTCTKLDVISICDFLLETWRKMYCNHHSIFFKWFSGFTRELIVEIDGEMCRPYLQFILFADKTNLPTLENLKNLIFFGFLKMNKVTDKKSFEKIYNDILIPLEEIPQESYEKVLDELMLPCIRVINSNVELEELLDMYQYNKQLSSRGGIVSNKNLERNVSLDMSW